MPGGRDGADPGRGVRNEYARHPGGAAGWYREHGDRYRNPHEDGVAGMTKRSVALWPECFAGRVLDLACGSGEVTLALLAEGVAADCIDACDPFTAEAYRTRIGAEALPWSFAAIAGGCAVDRAWSAVVCSYALHLCPPSWLPSVCLALAATSPNLIVITPHKRPVIAEPWGWLLVEEHHDPAWRVRLRRYVAAP